MWKLQEQRLKRSRERNGDVLDRSDSQLHDYENKVVVVEYFNALEDIDKDLRE